MKNITRFNQNECRDRLFTYINQKGAKYIYVAAKIDVTPYVLSRFRHGGLLWDITLDKLDNFLKGEGF
jgi:hypothetical protein